MDKIKEAFEKWKSYDFAGIVNWTDDLWLGFEKGFKSRESEIKILQDALIRYTGLIKTYDLDDDGELLSEMEAFCWNEIEKGRE